MVHLYFDIESINSFVEVVIDLSSSAVSCNFFNQLSDSTKSCTIEYGPSGSCDILPYMSQSNYSTHSRIEIDLLTHHGFHNERMYCYTITASNGTLTVAVDGIFNTGIYASILNLSLQTLTTYMIMIMHIKKKRAAQ